MKCVLDGIAQTTANTIKKTLALWKVGLGAVNIIYVSLSGYITGVSLLTAIYGEAERLEL